jgi:hypothetical protein
MMHTTRLTSDSNGDLMAYIAQMEDRLADRTKREYTSRMREISKKIRVGADDTLKPAMVLARLREMVEYNEIAASTFRLYKSAIMYWIAQQAQALIASGDDTLDYGRAFAELKEINHDKMRSEVRTSAKKLKVFPVECKDALSKFAKERGHRAPNAARASAFADANLLVGLRPIEWFDACFASYIQRHEDGTFVRDANGKPVFEYMLVVENAKATHGRGNGKRRELILKGVTSAELKTLFHFWKIVTDFRERHSKDIEPKNLTNLFYRPMNNMIRRALTASGFASRDIPSVYSTRHQVVSDFKASGIKKREIAAFFGHSSDETHSEHYGYKRSGSRGVTFHASPESVAQVSRRSTIRPTQVLSPEMSTEIESWVQERDSGRNQ